MPEFVYRVAELVGSSKQGIDDAMTRATCAGSR